MAKDPLTTLEAVKGWLGEPPEEENADEVLNSLIIACSQQIAEYCGRDNLGAIQTYQENVRMRGSLSGRPPRILLRRYPVVTLTSVIANNNPLTILTASQVQTQTGGVFLEDDERTLSFLGLWAPSFSGYVQVNYSAGYTLIGAETLPQSTPQGLRQACNQFVSEVWKSKGWIGFKSKSLAGEVVTFEGGAQWGMSPRTKAMLQPFVNRMPPYV